MTLKKSRPVEEQPPPYFSSDTAGPSGLQGQGPPSIARCNLLMIKRKDVEIRGMFVLDPDMQIAEAMLAPLPEDETIRKHMNLYTKHADITSDVWISPSGAADAKESPCTLLELKARNVTLNLHGSDARPFSLEVECENSGTAIVTIPRTFRGPLTLRGDSVAVSLSYGLAPLTATFSDVDGVRKCFVGDCRELGFGDGEWHGSAIDIKAKNGKIKLRFVDELEKEQPKTSKWGW